MRIVNTDVLVIGSGVAGLHCAWKCAEFADVVVVTKKRAKDGSTTLAQGGIACVLPANDSFEKHIEDTFLAGGKLGNMRAIETMVREAPERILELQKLGLKFDSDDRGNPDLALEGGHCTNRVLHVKDHTGRALEDVLLRAARRKSSVSFFENGIARDLFLEDDKCRGAWVWDEKTNDYVVVKAKFTVLATGGAGRVYAKTTNPVVATGDGFSMAQRANVDLRDMSYVQFHPTALHHPKAQGFLISEALRGAGAELVLPTGEHFMQKYNPMGSLAPRDIVCSAISQELIHNNLECVYLSCRGMSEDTLKEKFPGIYAKCKSLGIHIPADLIPVSPSAHYMCGGIKTDLYGQSSLPNLFAVGEVASTGVHGANRLASNSLLEGLVFSERAAKKIKHQLSKFSETIGCPIPFFVFNKKYPEKEVVGMKKRIQHLMTKNAGVQRTESGLLFTLKELRDIHETALQLQASCFPQKKLLELVHISKTSILICADALEKIQRNHPQLLEAELQ